MSEGNGEDLERHRGEGEARVVMVAMMVVGVVQSRMMGGNGEGESNGKVMVKVSV